MLRSVAVSLAVAVLAVFAAAVAPNHASAQVAFGPPLNVAAPNTAEGCEFLVLPPLRLPGAIPPSCTMFGINFGGQWLSNPTPGQWTLTQANVRTGPRTGPMQFVVLRAFRSQDSPTPEGMGAICCTAVQVSQVFTPPANQITTINTNLPMSNTVDIVNGERVEVVDRLGISLLNLNSSLPAVIGVNAPASMSIFGPAFGRGQTVPLSFAASHSGAFPLISGRVCPRAGATISELGHRAHQVGCAPIGAPPVNPGPGSPAPGPAPGGSPQAGIASSLRQVGIAGNGPRVAIPLACGAGQGRCTGSTSARTVLPLPRGQRGARPVTIAARPFAMASGRSGAATLVLPALARRELTARGTLALQVTVNPAGGSPQTRRVTLRSLPANARAARNGAVSVLLDMPPNANASQQAVVQLRQGASVVAQTRARTRPGLVVPQTLILGARQRAQLARAGRLRLTLRATYRDASNRPVVRARAVTVLAPAR